MAYRTTTGEVQEILMDEYGAMLSGALPNLNRFIRAANILVNRMIACATAKGFTHTSEEAQEIECWLAAHNYKMSDKGAAEERTGGASIVYQGQTGMNLDATFYGQTAQTLDTSGCLASFANQKSASIDWLGKPPSTQIPYDQRD